MKILEKQKENWEAYTFADKLLLAVCILFFIGAYILWRVKNTPDVWMQDIASIASLLLFLLFLYHNIASWRKAVFHAQESCETHVSIASPRFACLQASLICLASLLGHMGIVYLVRVIFNGDANIQGIFQIYTALDSNEYIRIASEGYTHANEAGELLNLVFLPGYPFLIRLFAILIPNYLVCGYLAAWIPFLFAGPMLYKLLRLDFDHRKSMRILTLLCLSPAAVFFAYPMSESLFLLCAVGCLYCVRTRRFFLSGLCGFFAAVTRSIGVLLLVPMAIEYIGEMRAKGFFFKEKKFWRGAECFVLTMMGLCFYLCINWLLTGNFFTFAEYQRTNWYQRLCFFFETSSIQTYYACDTAMSNITKFLGLWLPNLMIGFLSLAIMIRASGRMRPAYTSFFAVYYLICYGTTWLLSGPRYIAVFFPLCIAVDELKIPTKIMMIIFSLFTVLYSACFSLRWGVW